MLKWIKHYCSLKDVGGAFTDKVSGRSVRYYRDCYGKVFMKDSRWSIFAVPTTTGTDRRE